MVSSTNINDDCIVELEKVRYLEKNIFDKENERTNAATGDIFFTSVGSLGRSCVYEGGLNICFQRSVSVIHTLIFNYYLKYCLDSAYIQQKIVREATGTAQKGFYLNQLALLLIPIPPIKEQHRIVSKYLETVQMQKEYYKTNETLDVLNSRFPATLKKSILQYAVQGKLVPQDPADEPASVLLERIRTEKEQLVKEGKIKRDKHESVIFRRDNSYYEKVDGIERCIDDELPLEIPESWEWCRLGTILQKLTDGTHSTPKYTARGIPFISVKDISSGKISFERTKFISKTEHELLASRCDPHRDDILLTKVGTTGIPVLVDTDRPFSIFVSVAQLRFSTELLDKFFLIYLLKSPLVQTQCRENTKGVGNKNWVMRDIANTLICIPPLAEQKRIQASLANVLKSI